MKKLFTLTVIFALLLAACEQPDDKNSQISFLSQVTVEYLESSVVKNDTLNFGETAVNNSKQVDFVLKNTGVGKLLLTGGTEPVKINSAETGIFSVVQPSGSEIAPGGSLPFKINFTPKSAQTYTATVTIGSNDQNGDFTFTITAVGIPRKPIATIFYNDDEILQNGTINADEVFITQSKPITVVIKNTGVETLALDIANITITGADDNAFIRSTYPDSSVLPDGQTSFNIDFRPDTQGENNAVLTIPTNDSSRNPVVIYLKMTGVKGAPVLELHQNTTVISNNSLTPFDFGVVTFANEKPITFIIKNTGNVALNLTGSPIVSSSNIAFTVNNWSTNKTLNPGSSTSFSIMCTPWVIEEEVTGTITIMNNCDDTPFTFTVKGTGRDYIIGDEGPGGGIVFYTAAGSQYLECSGELGSYNWTDAVSAAKNHRGGGFNDWRLPDKDELDLIYEKRTSLGDFLDTGYWSSTEDDSGENAYFQSFANSAFYYYTSTDSNGSLVYKGQQACADKISSFRVRAVRTFYFY